MEVGISPVDVDALTSPLDNAVWHALHGPRRHLGRVGHAAAVFDVTVSPFSALVDEPDGSAWDELAGLVGPGSVAVLFRSPVPLPPAWEVVHRVPCPQMVAGGVAAVDDERLEPLGADDVPEMRALADATKPGPFSRRTVEHGGYLGIRDGDGRLVAMAGERFRVPGATEISAVCTDADRRGQGLATALVLGLVHRIRARGEEAFLHAEATNTSAIRLYEDLGFQVRRQVEVTIATVP